MVWEPVSAEVTVPQILQEPELQNLLSRQAYDKGIRFFDCADSYGTHPFTAAALKGIPREKYILSSKIWVSQGGIPEPERPDADVVIDTVQERA